MEIYLKKQGHCLIPDSNADNDKIALWADGDLIKCTTHKVRNPKFHRLVFAFLNFIFQNQERYETLDDLLIEFKLRSGYYAEHVTTKGVLVYVPKSISFEKCDELQFRELYNKWIDIAIKYFVPTMTKLEVERAVELILNFN